MKTHIVSGNMLKAVRTGCGLKIQLREFLAYVIFMVFRVYLCKKNIPTL